MQPIFVLPRARASSPIGQHRLQKLQRHDHLSLYSIGTMDVMPTSSGQRGG
jgi:hypothetical protein